MKNGSKKTRLDICTGSRTQIARQRENFELATNLCNHASCKNCKDSEADRGRDATKGIQYRIVTRVASLKLRTSY